MRDWNEYYSEPANLDFTPTPLLVQVTEMLPAGRALDLACGAGRNAIFLSQLGWRVTAVDAAPAAIRVLREKAPGVDARVAASTASIRRDISSWISDTGRL